MNSVNIVMTGVILLKPIWSEYILL